MSSRRFGPGGDRAPDSNFFVVTPAHNEIRYIRGLVHAIANQSKKPIVWLIIDDGSTDGTGELVEKALKDFPALDVLLVFLKNPNPSIERRFRPINLGISLGLAECSKLKISPKYIAIVDADTIPAPNYFEAVCQAMETNERIGIGSGVMFDVGTEGSRPFVDPRGTFILAGAAVTYRLSFLDDIGGHPQSAAPDTVAFYRGKNRGWLGSVTPKTRFFHLRTVHSWKRRLYDGGRFYKFGSPLLGAVFASAYFTLSGPKRLAGPAYLIGYSVARLRKMPKLEEPLVLEAFGNKRVVSMFSNYLLRRPRKSDILII